MSDYRVYWSGGSRVRVDLHSEVTRGALGFRPSTGLVGAEVEGNGISPVSNTVRVVPSRGNCSTPDVVTVTFYRSASSNCTSKDRDPCSAVILPATHVGPAAKFWRNTKSPSMTVCAGLSCHDQLSDVLELRSLMRPQ